MKTKIKVNQSYPLRVYTFCWWPRENGGGNSHFKLIENGEVKESWEDDVTLWGMFFDVTFATEFVEAQLHRVGKENPEVWTIVDDGAGD